MPNKDETITASHNLDARGLFCPEPVMLLHKKIREVEDGQILLILATDPATERDIAKFCRFLGHELISAEEQDKEYHFLLRKNATA
jgi:tRNA 2-thiouridine synthesizing protein A